MLHCFSRVIFGNVGFSLKRAKRFATTVRPLISVSHIDLRLLLLAHQKRNFSTQKVPLRIVLIGPPGSGKGTQALKIERDFGPTPISTGHLLRAAAAGNSEFARRLREILERGGRANNERDAFGNERIQRFSLLSIINLFADSKKNSSQNIIYNDNEHLRNR
jgi:hypothetical protein